MTFTSILAFSAQGAVHIVDDLFRFHPRPVCPGFEIEEHVQEVGGLHVGLDLEAQAMPSEDFPHLLTDLLHLSGAEGTDTQEVVLIQVYRPTLMGRWDSSHSRNKPTMSQISAPRSCPR